MPNQQLKDYLEKTWGNFEYPKDPNNPDRKCTEICDFDNDGVKEIDCSELIKQYANSVGYNVPDLSTSELAAYTGDIDHLNRRFAYH